MMSRVRSALGIIFAALLLGSCGLADDKAPDYRYRLTVEVETPEGLKTGSSVIEVEQKLVRWGADPGTGLMISSKVRGEAVAVDLPGGQTLYALLRSENDVDWASRVYTLLSQPIPGETASAQAKRILELKDKQTLPRLWLANVLLDERSAYPVMVTFENEADPTSVKLVDPDDLAATFGEGVALKRITVELTNARVTETLEDRLGWIEDAWSHAALKDGPFYAKYPTVILGLKGHSQ
ncbi:MAG: hypothetical protein AAF249_05930 [Pseudomonadota bacterium]